MKKLLVIEVAALGYDFLCAHGGPTWEGLGFRPAGSVFPALTCTVQATFRTAAPPSRHGMVANGLFFPRLGRAMFWEQSARLVEGRRIWSHFRRRGGKVALLFWQQSLGEDADGILSPAPIHKHHGGLIQDCYSQPADLYGRLCSAMGRRFNLMHYWGPLASWRSGQWIAEGTVELLGRPGAPDLCLTYLPTLDYDLQRHGPRSRQAVVAAGKAQRQLSLMLAAARRHGYEVLVFGDYAMGEVTGGAVFPNRVLAEAGLMSLRRVKDRLYPDLHTSRAWALVDHEVAHVSIREPGDVPRAAEILSQLAGVAEVMDERRQAEVGLAHRNAGQLVLLAAEGTWFAYPWWTRPEYAPDYARHVDIHSKPGFDPCELFFGWPPMSVSLDAGKVRGTHGRVGPRRQVAWAATFDLPALDAARQGPAQPRNIVELASAAAAWLEE